MLLYGNYTNIPVGVDNLVIFNITGFTENYRRLAYLTPPFQSIGYLDSYDYDQKYFHYIMNTDYAFVQMFLIVQQLYAGRDVYLIADDADWSINQIESLCKVIQQRYGYNAAYVGSPNDFLFYASQDQNEEIVLQNLDSDKERYSYIVNMIQLQPENQKKNIKKDYE